MDENVKVLVDSSVWIDFLRNEREAVTVVTNLVKSERIVICGQILQEVLQGSRDEKAFKRLEKEMAIWKSEKEEPEDFVEAAHIFARLRWKGITIPPTDCLVAAIAIRRNLQLFAHDEDFDDIPNLRRYKPN
jgi:predicted nucleic acid-binding protein